MADTSPQVTVIIATYNKSATLRYAIESVLWQSMMDYELWVVGDGCTDDSEEVVTSFSDPRVQWYNLPKNSGSQSGPHNEGLHRARGKYIAYLHHDDIWLPDHLQVLVDALERSGGDVAFSILEWALGDKETNYADIPQYPGAARPPEASATMHRRDIIDDIGYWRSPQEAYSFPRADFFRRAQFAGKRFELVPLLTVLKIGAPAESYAQLGPQPSYMQMIRDDPDFAHKRVAALLVHAYEQLQRPTPPKQFLYQLGESARRQAVARGIDPARLAFWRGRGSHIRKWRRAHKID